MKIIFSSLLFSLFIVHGTSAQTSFKFKYYEVYKVKTFDTLYRWEGGKKRNTFDQPGAVVINERSKWVKFKLSKDKYEVKQTIFKVTPAYYQLTSGWIAFRQKQDENGNYLAVYHPKGNIWVVYYDYPRLEVDVD